MSSIKTTLRNSLFHFLIHSHLFLPRRWLSLSTKQALKDSWASLPRMPSTLSVRKSRDGITNTGTKGQSDNIYQVTGPTVLTGLLSVAQGHNQGEGSSKTGLQPQPMAPGHCSGLTMPSPWLQPQLLWRWQCTPVCRGHIRVTCTKGLRIQSRTLSRTLRELLKHMEKLQITRQTLWNFKIWNPTENSQHQSNQALGKN